MDVFLVIAIIVALSILLVVSLYLVVYYQHPDDHNDAYAPKLVVMLGFCLAGWTVLMFPLDVANNEGYAGTCYCVTTCAELTDVNIGTHNFLRDDDDKQNKGKHHCVFSTENLFWLLFFLG